MRIIKILSFFVVGIVLIEFVNTVPAYGGWSGEPTYEQQTNMNVPGMNNWNPGFWKQVVDKDSGTGFAYLTQWRRIQDYGVHAYLIYEYRRSKFYYYNVRDNVRFRLGSHNTISFIGDIRSYNAKLGEFQYVHFSIVAGKSMSLRQRRKQFSISQWILPRR